MKPHGLMAGTIASMIAFPAAAMRSAAPSVVRPDGTVIHVIVGAAGHQRKQDAIIVLQGTGCEPVADNPRLKEAAMMIAPSARSIMIDKYGVDGTTVAAGTESCPQATEDHNTLQQRVLDTLQVAAALRVSHWWSGRLVLFGGSEGGAVAAMVAPLVPETKAVIILSSAMGVPLGELVTMSLPPAMAAEAPAVFRAAEADPSGTKHWAGLSYRWWADAVNLVPARALAVSPAPVLIIHGTLDRSSPVAAARAGRDWLLRAGKSNVTYREYALYDHSMTDATGTSHFRAVLTEAGAWLADTARQQDRAFRHRSEQ